MIVFLVLPRSFCKPLRKVEQVHGKYNGVLKNILGVVEGSHKEGETEGRSAGNTFGLMVM
jgi:hypothetical protein